MTPPTTTALQPFRDEGSTLSIASKKSGGWALASVLGIDTYVGALSLGTELYEHRLVTNFGSMRG